jgi:hypothetical protein
MSYHIATKLRVKGRACLFTGEPAVERVYVARAY